VAERAIDEWSQRRAELAARLDKVAPEDLEPLKAEIGALFKAVEREINELTTLKAGILELIEKWKVAKTGQPASITSASVPTIAPTFSGERPEVHADHIGASTFIEKGWSKISLGDYPGAEEALGKALQLSPNDAQAESLLGWAQMLQDKFDDALMNFQKVLVREPQNALARINVGYICLKKRIFGEAIEHLSRAIRLDNDKKATLYAHFYLGLVYLERDMFEDAQTFFEKAIALGPNLIEAYYELGRAFWFNGQHAEAVDTWKRGLAQNKFNPWGKRCAEVLKVVEAGGQP
jgi:tetratricopeptide (TPR) repeat protein